MSTLIKRPVKRIFTFGCSFTHYFWSTWPEIIAYDLDIPLYNFGKSGAGNQYIANSIVQANIMHNFNEDDLIIVSWTSVCREDRWRKNDWVNSGNIYTQDFFDKKFIKEWADPVGYMLRDFATINLVHNLLKSIKCQYHLLAMCDIHLQMDQGNGHSLDLLDNNKHRDICKLYQKDLTAIMPSFFKVLWNNDVYLNKLIPDKLELGKLFSDGHPNPRDHFTYLKKIFPNHNFKKDTTKQVNRAQENFVKFIREQSKKINKSFAIYSLSHKTVLELRQSTLIKQSEYSTII